jgi:hypothetical protein
MSLTREQRIMWLANVRNLPFRERVEATAKATSAGSQPRQTTMTKHEPLDCRTLI